MRQASSAQTDVAARVWAAMHAFVAANDRNRELQEGLGLGRGKREIEKAHGHDLAAFGVGHTHEDANRFLDPE